MSIKQNILLIINPAAGRQSAKYKLFKIVDLLSRNDCKTTIFTTSGKGDAAKIVRDNCADAHKIICCGGDGTMNEVIEGLMTAKLKIPIGYIPTGTMNDLAHALNLSTRTKKALYDISNGNVRDHDIGSFNNNQYFSYVASFGAFIKTAYTTPQWIKNLIGRIAYFFHSLLQIGDIRPHAVKVIADGVEIAGDFIYGSVSNSTVIGGGSIKFTKAGVSFDDGLFEVMLIRNPTTPEGLSNIISGVLKQKYDVRYMRFFKAKKLIFIFDKETDWTIDGEYAGSHSTVYIENQQRAASIISGC